jgi:hypothetical protein
MVPVKADRVESNQATAKGGWQVMERRAATNHTKSYKLKS